MCVYIWVVSRYFLLLYISCIYKNILYPSFLVYLSLRGSSIMCIYICIAVGQKLNTLVNINTSKNRLRTIGGLLSRKRYLTFDVF